ncbi:MAG: hypothetical protein R3B96_05990 [Pirellulaceae bacterium]
MLKAIRQCDSSARVLGVTGIREAEGRSTLSICFQAMGGEPRA